MAVGRETVNRTVQQLLYTGDEYTTKELAKLMGIGLSTAQQVVSVGMMLGSIRKNDGYPAKYQAIKERPGIGETLIIKEPIPSLELDRSLMETIKSTLAIRQTPEPGEPLGLIFEAYYKILSPVGKQDFVKFLINFAEVIKETLNNETELHPEDLL